MRSKSQSGDQLSLTSDALAALRRAGFSRRSFLKGGGALIVTFSLGMLETAKSQGALEVEWRVRRLQIKSIPGSPSRRMEVLRPIAVRQRLVKGCPWRKCSWSPKNFASRLIVST